MANYFRVFPASDLHIDFLKEHPETVWNYIQGERPKVQQKPAHKPTIWQRLFGAPPAPPTPTPEVIPPDDWPSESVTEIGPAECVAGNVDLYHLILNGTTEFVEGSGSLFQTWLTNDKHSALTLHAEAHAFKSHQIPELLRLVADVTTELAQSRFTQWLRSRDDDYTPDFEASDEFGKEFRKFAEALRDVVKQSHGLIWVPG